MRFADPWWLGTLWFAPAVLAIFFWGHRRRARLLRRFASKQSLRHIAGDSSGVRRRIGAGLIAGALLLVSFALAGPQYGFRWRTTERRGVDLMVALDCSKSMLAEDLKPNRLARAKREVVDLLNRLEGDRIGLVAFAGTAYLQCPLTLDYAGFHVFLRALSPDFLPVGGTALADALDIARESFDPKSAADRAIIVITDGEETTGAAAEAAERARDEGIKIFVVGVGTDEGAPIPGAEEGFVKDRTGNIVLARLGEAALQKLAVLSGGAYVRSVPGDQDLDVVYEAVQGEMEAKTLESRKVKVWENRFQWPLALAVVALLCELALPLRKRTLVAAMAAVLLLGPESSPAQAGNAASLVREGLRHYEAGDYDAALEAFVAAQLEAPDASEIAFDLGNAYYRAGDFENALASYSTALHHASPEMKGRILYNRGNAAYRLGRLGDALTDYDAALEADPADENAKLNRAFVQRKIEEQPPPPREIQGDPPPSEQNSPEEKQEPGGGEETSRQDKPNREDAAGQAESTPEDGDEPDRGATPAAEDQADQTGHGRPSEPEDEPRDEPSPQQQEGRAGEARPATEAERRRAEGILNRLKDQPGKAMMPAYRERSIEKDW